VEIFQAVELQVEGSREGQPFEQCVPHQSSGLHSVDIHAPVRIHAVADGRKCHGRF